MMRLTSKSKCLLLHQSIQLKLVRFSSQLKNDDANQAITFGPLMAPYTKIHNEIEQGQKSALITSVFRKNVNRTIQMFKSQYEDVQVTGATYFEQETGLGKKPCLLIHLTEPIPWKRRIISFSSLQRVDKLEKTQYSLDIVNHKQLKPLTIHSCTDLSDQIRCLYENAHMSPKVSLFHGLIIAVLKDCLQQKSPDIFESELIPFGSSACGLSLQGSSDLDLTYIDHTDLKKFAKQNILRAARRCIERADFIVDVLPILHASVPIVKFKEQSTQLCIDLSISSRDGPIFTQLFWALNEYDNRVFTLILSLKFWSKVNKLSCIEFSNFTLTCLVIFFLQQKNIIPPLKYFTDNGYQLSRKEKFEHSYHGNSDTLDSLMNEFFLFYSSFKFSNMDIDLNQGTCCTGMRQIDLIRPAAMYIQNPYREELKFKNIARSVREENVDHFVERCRISLMTLDKGRTVTAEKEWGLNLILPCEDLR